MTRFFAITMAFAALGAAVGASPEANSERGLRGKPYEPTKYCNSIGCPNGFQPIEDASEVACDNNKCEVDQCCEAFCSSFPCGNGFIPIPYASTTRCYDDYCTQEQCCDLFCSSFPCPNGFIPIENADKVLCEDQKCDKYQCCDRVKH